MAEEVGFEPTVPSQVQRFSRPPLSTAQPLLRDVCTFRRPISENCGKLSTGTPRAVFSWGRSFRLHNLTDTVYLGFMSDKLPMQPIAAGTVIGHVHLKVADLERAVTFYTEVLGFEVTTRYGRQAAFLSAGGYHHHIALNTWESANGSPPPPGSTGLYHFAILVPSRKELARSLKRLTDFNWPLEGAADHGVSEAIYLRDPDGNGVEIYHDRPRDQWPHDANGNLAMFVHQLDLDALLADAD